MEEIEILVGRFGVKEIHIEDDNFTFDKKYVYDFCQKLQNMKFNITWALPNGVRLNSLDRPLLQTIEKAGCFSFAVGIESGSDRILKKIKKNLTTDLVYEKIDLIKATTKIKITGFFIIGLPGENISDIYQTISFAKNLPLDRAAFSPYLPLPGTEDYKNLDKNGAINNLDWVKYNATKIVYTPPGISKFRMKILQIQASCSFYLRWAIIIKITKEIKPVSQIGHIIKRVIDVII